MDGSRALRKPRRPARSTHLEAYTEGAMILSRLAVAAIVAGLAASPAAAASRGATLTELPLTLLPSLSHTANTRTCQANGRSRPTSDRHSVVIADAHRLAIVACEQPPRSELIVPKGLGQETTSALISVG